MHNLPEIPVSQRFPYLFVEKGRLEKKEHTVILHREEEEIPLPVGMITVLFMQPGTSITHGAVQVCSEVGCNLIWVGDDAVRLYSTSNLRRNGTNLLRQASLHLNPSSRLEISRKIFQYMFREEPPLKRSIEQLRGMEGIRVREMYADFANEFECSWGGRITTQDSDLLNKGISYANAALYGLVESVILALGYSPAIGYTHSGGSRSFVYDVSDCIKFKTVVPLAFQVFKESPLDISKRIRVECGLFFQRNKTVGRIATIIEDLLETPTDELCL